MEQLKDILMREMSRRNTDSIIELIRQKPLLFDEIMQIYLDRDENAGRRAAWVADIYSENNPDVLFPYQSAISGKMENSGHDGLKRHSLRMLSRLPLPETDKLGPMIKICFDWLLSPEESVAVKVFCMEMLYRISQLEPDLKKELADSIEWRIAEEKPGFRNKGAKLLHKLYAEIALKDFK